MNTIYNNAFLRELGVKLHGVGGTCEYHFFLRIYFLVDSNKLRDDMYENSKKKKNSMHFWNTLLSVHRIRLDRFNILFFVSQI